MILEENPRIVQLTEEAVTYTKDLIESSGKHRNFRDNSNRKRIARLFKDPDAIEATITSSIELMRR